MTPPTLPSASLGETSEMNDAENLPVFFHRLNNQLGIILSHSELVEAKATDDMDRSRAGLIVGSLLDAMSTAREIRFITGARAMAGQGEHQPR